MAALKSQILRHLLLNFYNSVVRETTKWKKNVEWQIYKCSYTKHQLQFQTVAFETSRMFCPSCPTYLVCVGLNKAYTSVANGRWTASNFSVCSIARVYEWHKASPLRLLTYRYLTWLIVHTTSLYLIIALLLLMYTQVFLRVQFLAIFFSPCILSLCLPLLTHTLSYIIHLLMTYNCWCLLPQIEYLSYFTLCSHVSVMSKLGQLRTCFNLMTTWQNSCLSPLIELSISIAYLLLSL